MFKFSNKSLQILNTADERLATIAREVIKISKIDFAIVEGLRSLETQQQYFREGKSQCDGIINKSKHQARETDGKAEAIDIMCLNSNGNGTWKWEYYKQTAELFKQKAEELEIKIVWGGDWKGLKDGVHFELG